MYMGVVGWLVISGRKRLLRLTSTHLKAREIRSSLMRIGEFMKRISAIAEQLDFNRAWELTILAAFRKWLGGNRAKACFRNRSRLSAEALRVENGKPLPKQRKRAEIHRLKRRFASSNCRI